MKIFITGITGLLGRNVAELCAKDGHEIVALVRDRKVKESQWPFKLSICYGDISDIKSLPEKLDGSEVIINCAANTSMISFRNLQHEETNIKGVKNLIVRGKEANIRKFIHISTANTILHGDNGNYREESVKLSPKRSRLPYINTKIISEEILLNEFKVNGFPVVILNPTFMLGPNDYHVSSGKLILSILKKKAPFYPSGGKNIVDVRDVAEATVNTIHSGKLGNNYLLSNENVTYRELFEITCTYAGIKAPGYKMPKFIGFAVGLMGTFYELVFQKTFGINHKTIKLAFENHYYKAHKAKTDLKFSPRPAEETIKGTVKWFHNEYLPN
jgi:dihydroflavonol-4-reductase